MSFLVESSSLFPLPRIDSVESAPACSPPPSLPSPSQMPTVPSSISLREADPWAYFGIDCSAKSPIDSVLLDMEASHPNSLHDSLEHKPDSETTHVLNKWRRNPPDSFVDEVLLGLEYSPFDLQRNQGSTVAKHHEIKQLPAKRKCPLKASLIDMEDVCLEFFDKSCPPRQPLATEELSRKRKKCQALDDANFIEKHPAHPFAVSNMYPISSQSSNFSSGTSSTDCVMPVSKRKKHSTFEGIRRAKIKVSFSNAIFWFFC